LTGPGYLTHEAGGYKYRVSHLSFFQVNRFLIEDLLKTVTANAQARWRWTCIRELASLRCRLQRCSRKWSAWMRISLRPAIYTPMRKLQVSQSYRTTNMRKIPE